MAWLDERPEHANSDLGLYWRMSHDVGQVGPLPHGLNLIRKKRPPIALAVRRNSLGFPPYGSDKILGEMAKLLSSGLKTKTEPFPETEKEFGEILDELRHLDPKDLEAELVVGGFADHLYGEGKMRCLVLPRAPQMVRPTGAIGAG